MLGDSSWWPGPPSFGVRPLDSSSMPYQERYHVIQGYSHIGTAEMFEVEFTMWSTTSAATTQMTNLQSAFGTSASGAKVGDQALYYGSQTRSAAPFETATFIRIGQVITTITESRKDKFPAVADLGKIAGKVAGKLKDVLSGKVHPNPLQSADAALLPPPGPDITLLGSAKLPVEMVVVMLNFAAPESLSGILRRTGADSVVFGDYVLDNDTHMEVRAGLLDFSSNQNAADWIDALRGSATFDTSGVASFYDDASGQYFVLFRVGTKSAMLVCRSTATGEAASRACESPLSRVGPAWAARLGGA